MEMWAWEEKCCLAVKVVSSSVRELSLKIVSAILHNIMLVFWISGLVQHLPQQNLVVYYKTLPGSLHTAAAWEGPE